MAFIFLDESGQFQKHTKGMYFVIGSFLVSDPRRTGKRFFAWRQAKYPRKMAIQSEIKYSDNHIHPDLKRKTVQFLGKLNLCIRYSYLNVENIPLEFRDGSALLEGHLYAHVVAATLAMYFPIVDQHIFIYCDQRQLKNLSREEFVTIVRTHLLPLADKNTQLFVEMVDSTSNINIQIADWLAGAIAAYHNQKPLGEECMEHLKNSIAGSKEFFKDYWLEKQKTQP